MLDGIGDFVTSEVPNAITQFVTTWPFPVTACILLFLWGIRAFFSEAWLRSGSFVRYLRHQTKLYLSGDAAAAEKQLSEARDQSDLGIHGAQLSASFRLYKADITFDNTSKEYQTNQPAELNFAHLADSSHPLSQVADQIIRTALLLTFFGIAYGLAISVALINTQAGADPSHTIAGIKQLLATASAKFYISAWGLFLAVVLRFFDARRTRAIESAVFALCNALDRHYLAEAKLAGPEIEAANHLIESVGKRFDDVNKSIADLVQGFGRVSAQVERWHDIASKIVGERYNYQLGPDPQSFVQGSLKSIEDELLEQFLRTMMLHRAQQDSLQDFAGSVGELTETLKQLQATLKDKPRARKTRGEDATASRRSGKVDK